MNEKEESSKRGGLMKTMKVVQNLGLMAVGLVGYMGVIGLFTAGVFTLLAEGKIDLITAVMAQVIGMWFFHTVVIVAKA